LEIDVLVVDDEEDFALALAERLALRGIRARRASDGKSALTSIKAHTPQVVLLDLMMPGQNGLEVLKAIKDFSDEIQVILLTGVGALKEGMQSMRLGAFDYLMKPVDIEVLTEKILEAAGRKA
jgi:DNA-binding NtrC family response regulator